MAINLRRKNGDESEATIEARALARPDHHREGGPVVDTNRLARHLIEHANKGPLEFAPPSLRDARPIEQVKSFGELPTRELDEIIAAAEGEIASLKHDAQAVRDLYVKHTERIAADLERLREGVRLSLATMKELREQCVRLNDGTLPIKSGDAA